MLWQWFNQGGPIMWVIAAFAWVGLAFSLERCWFWFAFSMRREAWLEKELLTLHVNADRVRRTRDPVCKIMADYLRDPEDVAAPVAGAERLLRETRKHLKIIEFVSGISTSLGLLGTVLGVPMSFQALADGDSKGVVQGLAVALNTTILGLVVFLALFLFTQVFKHLTQDLGHRIEERLEHVRVALRKKREREPAVP